MLTKRYQFMSTSFIQEVVTLPVLRDILIIVASASVIFAVANQTIKKSNENVYENSNNTAAGANVIRSYDYKNFSWALYQSPANPVFFDEGEGHIPPRPYVYLAQNPTLENAIKLQEWQRKKMEVTNQITQLLIEASKPMDIKKLAMLSPSSLNNFISSEKIKNNTKINDDLNFNISVDDFKNVSILYFYRTDCSHCKNTKPTIDKLISMGVRVVPVQLDYKINSPEFKNSMPYDSQIASVFPVTETPTFVLKVNNESRSLKGEVTALELSKVISLIRNNKG